MNKKNRNTVIFALIGFIITFIIGMKVRGSAEGILFDLTIMEFIHKNNSLPVLSLMKFITCFGSKEFFIIVGSIVFIYFLYAMERQNANLVLGSIVGSYILNASLKLIFSRVRPLSYMLIEQAGYSYPSGHSMVSMSFYTTIAYILLEKVKDQKIKTIIWIGNFVLIGLIGFSRIYLGVHWPTDVIVGYTMGYIFFLTNTNIIKYKSRTIKN